ncbi:hypothetical protein NE237_032504 [Protea cynaroides]|uniref:Uncharacterized protein n=1 Tax=Protea cynaroides TaxID=273540 RepID=A0A9Q0L396_9MAGN|nr:hypothetical protein NE237_032504 [Protea cynaroides]
MVEGQIKTGIIAEEPHQNDEQQRPLLGDSTPNPEQPQERHRFIRWRRHYATPISYTDPNNWIQKVIDKTFKSTGHLSNLLPTGTVLGFQLLSPIFTHQGRCNNDNQSMTVGLVTLFALSCFLSSFTDSIRDDKGTIRYGIATFRGLWIINGSATISPEQAAEFKLKFVDFLHAFMSAMVFSAVALLDPNVMNCFYPIPSKERERLTSLPVAMGIIGSVCFMTFPTTRHGIGFPLSPR